MKGTEMKQQNISYLFNLGTDFQFLVRIEAGTRCFGEKSVDTIILRFLESLEKYDLHVTRECASQLEDFQTNIGEKSEDRKTTKDEALEIRKIMKDIWTVLYAEAPTKYFYVLSDKRLGTKRLLDDVGALFAEGIFEQLPDISKKDFVEAGRCIASECPTAAACLILRATEAVLRHVYICVVRQKRLPVNQRTWGKLVGALRGKRKGPSEDLLNDFQSIGTRFRNPTQHPDKIYDIEEVQNLWPRCADAIGEATRAERWEPADQ